MLSTLQVNPLTRTHNQMLPYLLLLSTLWMNMDQVNYNSSTKDIPIPSKKEYRIQLIHSTKKFYDNICWRVWHYKNPSNREKPETFGFTSTKKVPRDDDLKALESDLYDLVEKIEFRDAKNDYQKDLTMKIENIKSEKKVIVPADKTSNFYKMDKEDYLELVEKNVHKEYKKAQNEEVAHGIEKQKEIVNKLNLDDRVFATQKKNCFVNLKDHKPNFHNKPTSRLINPCKPEIGKISKKILAQIVKTVRDKSGLIQWKNTGEVIDWFENIADKKKFRFIQFDIVNYYATISEELIKDAIKWAREFIDISEEEEDIILKCKMSLLYFKNEAWVKKSNSIFDVTMGSFDGAESTDLCGLFLLSKLKALAIIAGLYRDDGLALSDMNPRDTENAKKAICEAFKKYNLSVTIEANLTVVKFLDVQLDLIKGIYKPYIKDNDKPNYVHSLSNHPPGILKNIPISINRRLNSISANKEVFDEAAGTYQADLNAKGYKHQLKYEEISQTSTPKRSRHRRISWFNPPYSKSVKTNVGAKFLRIIRNNFPPNHPLHKILNKNTIKVSYRCMPNLKNHIDKHNFQVLKNDNNNNPPEEGCNCQVNRRAACPIPGRCTTTSVVYRAAVRRHDNCAVDCYTGLTGDRFKTRYNKHQSDIRTGKRTASKLSSHVCRLNDRNIQYDTSWDIVTRAPTFNPTSKVCRLCLTEAYHIIFEPGGANLNKRDELFGFCKHKWKKLLAKEVT
jgi:hypothetical protein